MDASRLLTYFDSSPVLTAVENGGAGRLNVVALGC